MNILNELNKIFIILNVTVNELFHQVCINIIITYQ